jgi:hypothetical protein
VEGSPSRNIRFDMIIPCQKAIKGLSRQRPSPIVAALNQFDSQWRSGASHEFLKARYDFKRVGADERCKSEGNMYQIRLLGQKYRALLTFLDTQDRAVWLDVFVKNPTNQENHIRTACERALRLREENL